MNDERKMAHRSSGHDCSMCTTTIGNRLDICDDVIGLDEIYPMVSTEGLAQLAFFFASINGDNAAAHVLRILDG